MPKNKSTKRFLKPDHKYANLDLSRFINKVMLDGKKTIAESIVYNSLDLLSAEVNDEPLMAFKKLSKILFQRWKLNLVELEVQHIKFLLKLNMLVALAWLWIG